MKTTATGYQRNPPHNITRQQSRTWVWSIYVSGHKTV